MSHSAFIPLDLYGLAGGGVCVIASLFHEFLSEHHPRSDIINVMALLFTIYHTLVTLFILSFFGYLYFSRSHIKRQYLKRKHGLDFSAFYGWTKHDFNREIEQTFLTFKKHEKIKNFPLNGKVLWADLSSFEVPTVQILPDWKKFAVTAVFIVLLWNARSFYLQLFVFLGNCYTTFIFVTYFKRLNILKAIKTRQIFDIICNSYWSTNHMTAPLDYFFIRKMFVITTIGMYSYVYTNKWNDKGENAILEAVPFKAPGLTLQIDLYTRINTMQLVTCIFTPCLIILQGNGGVAFTNARFRPIHFEEFVDYVHATIERRYKNNHAKVVAILFRKLPLNEHVIGHIVSFLPVATNDKPRVLIEVQEGDSEPSSGVREFRYPIPDTYYYCIKSFRSYVPRNRITFD